MRVIAGIARGTPLAAPRGGTRPTSDLVKGAMFAVLGERGCAGRVLDLYAGSGALGIEALSRGADEAVFVEASRVACRSIKSNLRKCRLEERATVYCLPVERALGMLEPAVSGRVRGQGVTGGKEEADAGTEGGVQARRRAGVQGAEAGAGAFDLVLLDPPYADERLDTVLARLGRSPLLALGATVVVEHAAGRELAPAYGAVQWQTTRRHGDSTFSVYGRADD